MKATVPVAGGWALVVCAAAIFCCLAMAGQQAHGAEAAPLAAKPVEYIGFKRTGWNAMVRQQFMYPPVLTYTRIAGAAKYKCSVSVSWSDVPPTLHLESATPEFDLAKIWDSLPAGPFKVSTAAFGAGGEYLAVVNSRCTRIASFKGPYRPAKCGYDESGAKFVTWFLKNKSSVSPSVINFSSGANSFPTLFYSAYIGVLTTYVRLHPQDEQAEEAMKAAKEYGQNLINLPDAPFQVSRGGMAGMAYLELYGVTQDNAWLDAACRIADTLKKNQLPEGRWPWRVEPKTGKILQDYTSDQAEAILLLDELVRNHGRKEFQETCDKAVAWMLENPCKTYLWQHQWDDMRMYPPYENLSWYDTALFIEYRLRHATPQNKYEAGSNADTWRSTQDKSWVGAACRIADTLKKNQLSYENLSWHDTALFIEYLLRHATPQNKYEAGSDADTWRSTQDKSWVGAACRIADTLKKNQLPYENLSWYDTALFIEYLLRHATPQNKYEAVAKDLMRYIEDQFVDWGEPDGSGLIEIRPSVREQYYCYVSIDAHCAHYIRTCMDFHAKTKDDVWLKKARAMADTLTAVQHPDGFYPTWMQYQPSQEARGELKDVNYGGVWPNCSAYSGEMLLRLGEYVKGAAGE